jgi:hypothetical protein
MTEPRPSIARLSLAYARAELTRDPGGARIAVPLYDSLANLVGANGFDVLLARSIVLARSAYPVLTKIETGPMGVLVGLGDAPQPTASIEPALAAIVANFIELLVALLGETLTMHLLHEALQDASNGADAPSKEAKK